MLGNIKNIEVIRGFGLVPNSKLNGDNGSRLGMSQMINSLLGYSSMDGYKIETEQHIFYVLIDNGQSCCESWGYMQSEDDLNDYIGSKLIEVTLTDTELNTQYVKETAPYGFDGGGIQFVNFITDNGVFQLAVYNSHNGYYGHGILVVKDDEILLNETL